MVNFEEFLIITYALDLPYLWNDLLVVRTSQVTRNTSRKSWSSWLSWGLYLSPFLCIFLGNGLLTREVNLLSFHYLIPEWGSLNSLWVFPCQLDKERTIALGKPSTSDSVDSSLQDALNQVNLQDLPLFRFDTLADATNNFCDANKLGKGGFGIVYKVQYFGTCLCYITRYLNPWCWFWDNPHVVMFNGLIVAGLIVFPWI